jgi:hypothetical protein
MLKQVISFTDFNNQPRTVTEYFNLSEAELVDMQASSKDGIQVEMEDAIKSNDAKRVLDFITMLVHKSYGHKTEDGLRFQKSPQILQEFIDSAYYSDFLLGLIQDNGTKGEEFVRGIMPKKLLDRALAKVQGEETSQYQPSAREQFDIRKEQANQPDYPRVNESPSPISAEQPGMSAEEKAEFAAFQAWKASRKAEASPDAFRVREEEPQNSLPRPPFEQSN